MTERFSCLQELYDSLPAINCAGKCYDECTLIAIFPIETENIRSNRKKIPHAQKASESEVLGEPSLRCSCLINKRCSIYSHRPLVCRLYGLVNEMRCEHGCVPDRMLTQDEADFYMSEMYRLSGNRTAGLYSPPKLAIEINPSEDLFL